MPLSPARFWYECFRDRPVARRDRVASRRPFCARGRRHDVDACAGVRPCHRAVRRHGAGDRLRHRAGPCHPAGVATLAPTTLRGHRARHFGGIGVLACVLFGKWECAWWSSDGDEPASIIKMDCQKRWLVDDC